MASSLALTAGRDPRWVMGQLGHTDARFTLSVYAQVMQRQRVDYDVLWSLRRNETDETWHFRQYCPMLLSGDLDQPFGFTGEVRSA